MNEQKPKPPLKDRLNKLATPKVAAALGVLGLVLLVLAQYLPEKPSDLQTPWNMSITSQEGVEHSTLPGERVELGEEERGDVQAPFIPGSTAGRQRKESGFLASIRRFLHGKGAAKLQSVPKLAMPVERGAAAPRRQSVGQAPVVKKGSDFVGATSALTLAASPSIESPGGGARPKPFYAPPAVKKVVAWAKAFLKEALTREATPFHGMSGEYQGGSKGVASRASVAQAAQEAIETRGWGPAAGLSSKKSRGAGMSGGGEGKTTGSSGGGAAGTQTGGGEGGAPAPAPGAAAEGDAQPLADEEPPGALPDQQTTTGQTVQKPAEPEWTWDVQLQKQAVADAVKYADDIDTWLVRIEAEHSRNMANIMKPRVARAHDDVQSIAGRLGGDISWLSSNHSGRILDCLSRMQAEQGSEDSLFNALGRMRKALETRVACMDSANKDAWLCFEDTVNAVSSARDIRARELQFYLGELGAAYSEDMSDLAARCAECVPKPKMGCVKTPAAVKACGVRDAIAGVVPGSYLAKLQDAYDQMRLPLWQLMDASGQLHTRNIAASSEQVNTDLSNWFVKYKKNYDDANMVSQAWRLPSCMQQEFNNLLSSALVYYGDAAKSFKAVSDGGLDDLKAQHILMGAREQVAGVWYIRGCTHLLQAKDCKDVLKRMEEIAKAKSELIH
ncbi:MAG TPA: hypothetical protein DCM05_10315 [Elusimicrobia bacterium]|nr:hypothetical protein [Elusimicrobiota bacterium]